MSFLDPHAEAQAVTDAVTAQLKTMFPYEGRKHNLVLKDVRVGESGDVGDIRGQKQAKLKGRTWAAPLYADLELQTKDGTVIDSVKDYKLLGLPRITNLLSYIVDGAETQISHQWHLKAGAYARVKDNGELTTQFNVSGAPGFSLDFSPETRRYTLGMDKSNVPLYPILRSVYGVSDDALEKTWGTPILEANRTVGGDRHVAKLYKVIFDKMPVDQAEAVAGIRENFTNSKMYGDTNELTLGAPISEVSDDALIRASSRLLKISRGEDAQDPRDALHFKDLWGIENYLPKRLSDMSTSIRRKIRNNLDRREKVSEIVHRDIFDAPVKSFFRLALAEQSHQVNPIAMLSDQRKTTIMGPMGGVQNEHAISIDDRLVDQSHLGFLDAIPSPEGSKTGITTFLPVGATKKGLSVYTKMYSPKSGKLEDVSPEKAYHFNVAFPDQYTWENGKPSPKDKLVKVNGKKNEFDEVTPDKVDYILPSAQALMTVSTNMIPFVQNDQGNRANYAAKQISQAISLVHRETPLVQVHTGAKDPKLTWERVIGKHFSAAAPIDGTVVTVGNDFIRIRGSDKKTHDVPLYRNYPLNDGKSLLDSEPLVKVGDKVGKGQTIADTNFSKNGTLAYGINARIAYMPWEGALTFEDGIIVSDAFAQRMTSQHLMQERLYADKNYLLDKKKYRGFYPDRLTDAQSNKLDDEGVIKVGQLVDPGDPLVVALKKSEPSKEQLILKGLHKSIVRPYSDASLVWENDHPGVVAEVVRNGREVLVNVKMSAPLQEADKISGRHGNKGVISRVLPVGDMPVDADGKPVEIVFNPVGVGARINTGQIYETLLGKVAMANGGGTYAVTNFAADPEKRIVQVDGHWRTIKTQTGTKEVWVAPHERSYYHLVKRELERAGLSDRERLFNPKTGEEYRDAEGTPGVLAGFQYFLKLEHTASKKLSARGQGAGFDYDSNMAPKGGGDSGGQSIGGLGIYALLGHGDATAIIREANTIKSDRSNEEWWAAFQAGQPTPPPKVPFAYDKFVSYLNTLGVNVVKKGSDLQLVPMTDKDILAQSRGEVVLNRLVRAKDLRPEKGGIFDEDLTGGMGGSGWSHAALPEPVPNPLFEKATAALTGLNLKEYNGLIGGTLGMTKEGALVPAEHADLQGGLAIEAMLKKIDIKKELEIALREVKLAKRTELDRSVKKAKYLRSLDRLGVRPEDVYLVHNLPVIPPKFRPMSVLEGGDLNVDDLNGMYQQIGILLKQLDSFPDKLPPELKNELRASVYDALASLAGLGGSMNEGKTAKKGILDIIAGPSPKDGFFHRSLLTRKQDLSMRGVIVPGTNLHLDQIGLPRNAAMVMFKPFVVRDLVRLGYSPNAARIEVDGSTAVAEASLNSVVRDHPVLVKRDPALHKFSMMAFYPKLIDGKSIRLHPLATGGYNADHDGNCFVGSTKVVLKFPPEAARFLPGIASEEAMKFLGESMIMGQGPDGAVVSMEIRDIPRLGVPSKDKNGALVYATTSGLKVWSYNHSTGASVFADVVRVTVEQDCESSQVTMRRGLGVGASNNESLYVYDHATGECVDCSPLEAIGRLSPVLRGIPAFGAAGDYELGWAIGAFASDGHVSRGIVGYTKLDDAKRNLFAQVVDHLDGMPVKRSTYRDADKQRDGYGFTHSAKDHFYHAPVSHAFFSRCYSPEYLAGDVEDRACFHKKLPPLDSFSRECLLGILAGLLEGDGSISRTAKGTTTFNVSTSSTFMLPSVQELCTRLGVRTSVTTYEPKPGRLQKATAYLINISSVDMRRVLPEMTFIDPDIRSLCAEIAGGDVKDDLDVVPVPDGLMTLLASTAGPLTARGVASAATIKGKRKPFYCMSRRTAATWLNALETAGVAPPLQGLLQAWAVTVRSPSVMWDLVATVTPLGKVEVFDLEVPETKVFAVNGGLVVYDTVSVYVPVTEEAQAQARKMLPSENLFNVASGMVMGQPTLEAQVGLFALSSWGVDKGKKFSTPEPLLHAAKERQFPYSEVVTLDGKKTTAGRVLLDSVLPKGMQGGSLLTDPAQVVDKKGLQSLMQEMAKKHPHDFAVSIDAIKDIGFNHSHRVGLTLTMADLEPMTEIRDKAFARADAVVAQALKKNLSKREVDKVRVAAYGQAAKELTAEARPILDKKNNTLFRMSQSGSKPSWDQIRQMIVSPVQLKDGRGNTIPIPVRHSYAEGLDFAEYWTAAHGARKGVIDKTIEVAEPGALSKVIAASVLNMVITKDDCGTRQGINLDSTSSDVLDRFTAQPVKLNKGTLAENTVITPEVQASLKASGVSRILVRSPMRCTAQEGLCAHCIGLAPNGKLFKLRENVGVMAGQSVGERSVQLTMKAFHSGGVAGGKGGVTGLDRLRQVLMVPETLAGSATLSKFDGPVQAAIKDPAGGWRVTIGGESHYVPNDRGEPTVAKGTVVKRGQALSEGPINPRELLELTNLETVQNYLAQAMEDTYSGEGLKRRNFEVVAKAMTNLASVEDSGDHPDYLRGDLVPASQTSAWNRENPGRAPVKAQPVLKGLNVIPFTGTEDWMARMNFQRLKETLQEGAMRGWRSNVHSTHPSAGMAYATEFGKPSADKPWTY